jgi:hypothetical protein
MSVRKKAPKNNFVIDLLIFAENEYRQLKGLAVNPNGLDDIKKQFCLS